MTTDLSAPNPPGHWRFRLHEIIFEADTPAGKTFDVLLIVSILGSVLAVMLDSIESVSARCGGFLSALEWGFTLLFTVEYGLRLLCVRRPFHYARSFFGCVDLLAVLPTYLSLLIPGTQILLVIRILRVLRVFRVLKLAQYLNEADVLIRALRDSRRKIFVFLFGVMTLVILFGSLMYMIEGKDSGFTSIPMGIYWAIVTMTTVGYGDISPESPVGRILAATIMILGYAIIAVPTGIVTAEMTRTRAPRTLSTQACPSCGGEGHDGNAKHCKHCGANLDPTKTSTKN